MVTVENWMRQGIFSARHFRGHGGIAAVENGMAGDFMPIKRSFYPQNCYAASTTTINNSYFLLKWPTPLFLMSPNQRMRNTAASQLWVMMIIPLIPIQGTVKASALTPRCRLVI
jgi:hypothetical protein